VTSGVADYARRVEVAATISRRERRTVVFIDEIIVDRGAGRDGVSGRHVESGLITLIGATTEESVVRGDLQAALSRMRLLVLHPLSEGKSSRRLVQRAARRQGSAGSSATRRELKLGVSAADTTRSFDTLAVFYFFSERAGCALSVRSQIAEDRRASEFAAKCGAPQ